MMKLALTRIAAFMVDYFVLAIFAALLSLIVTTLLIDSDIIPGESSPRAYAHLFGFVTLTLPVWLYFTLQEGSSKRATIGKRLLRLQVNALPPKSMTILRAGLRNAVKFLPWEIAHAAIWYVPGRPFLDQMPAANLIICLAACIVSLCYLASLFFSGGRTPYDHLAGTFVTGASTPPSPQSRH